MNSTNQSTELPAFLNDLTTSDYNNDLDKITDDIYFIIFGVITCIISAVGMLTNLTNIYALTQTIKTHRKPMYHFLRAMAIVDTMIMVILLCRSSRFFLVSPMLRVPSDFVLNGTIIVDKVTYYFYATWYIYIDVLMAISNWCTVLMGLFRIVAVFSPLRAASLCTVRRAQITIIIIVFFGIVINLPLYLEIRQTPSGVLELLEEYQAYSVITLIFTVPVPSFTCLVINLSLIIRIKLNRDRIEKMCETRIAGNRSQGMTGNGVIGGASSVVTSSAAERTLISVSLFYVIMAAPNMTFYLLSYTGVLKTWSLFDQDIFYVVANFCIYISHSGNFFFYVLLNKPFRTLLWRKAICQKEPGGIYSSTGSTRLPSAAASTTASLMRGNSRRATPLYGSRLTLPGSGSRQTTPLSKRKQTSRHSTPAAGRRQQYADRGRDDDNDRAVETIRLNEMNINGNANKEVHV